jgi:hypothetical protein
VGVKNEVAGAAGGVLTETACEQEGVWSGEAHSAHYGDEKNLPSMGTCASGFRQGFLSAGRLNLLLLLHLC